MSAALDAIPATRLDASQQDTGPAAVSVPTPCGNRPGPRWHVIYSHPQAERRAAQHLTEQGYQAYLPLIIVRRRDKVVRTLRHNVEVPLFSRYLFCRFDPFRDPWQPILHTLGVRSLLCRSDGMPDPCPEAAISALQAANAQRATPTPESALWAPGTPCSLATGMLAGHHALVLNAGNEMALIAVMMFGQLREVAVDVNCLRLRDDA